MLKHLVLVIRPYKLFKLYGSWRRILAVVVSALGLDVVSAAVM
jgi:hypothetical protein